MSATVGLEIPHDEIPGKARRQMIEFAEQGGGVSLEAYRDVVRHRDSLIEEIDDALQGVDSLQGIEGVRRLIEGFEATRLKLIKEIEGLRKEYNRAKLRLDQTLSPERGVDKPITMAAVVRLAEETAIRQALASTDTAQAAAAALEIGSTTLYRKMEEYGIPSGVDR